MEAVNAISGERHVIRIRTCFPIACCAPAILCTTTFCIPTWATAPVTTARFRSVPSHVMVDAYKRCRDYLDAAISLIQPGRNTAEIAAIVAPGAGVRASWTKKRRSRCGFGHGIGKASLGRSQLISRLLSLDHPHVLKPGMVFALETTLARWGRAGRRASRKKLWSLKRDTK